MFETVLSSPFEMLMLGYTFLMGACLGSFGNVVIYRMPAGKSIVRPGSTCGSCLKPIKYRHNIPIVGWFLLRGKCANCGAKYSVRYAMVELLMALLFAAAWIRFGWSISVIEALIFHFQSGRLQFHRSRSHDIARQIHTFRHCDWSRRRSTQS